MSNFITCSFAGRLGNQMFEIANAYAAALRYNREFKLYKDLIMQDLQHTPWYYPSIYENLMFRKLRIESKAPDNLNYHYIHSPFHYTEHVPHDIKPTKYHGYFQSAKNFEDYSRNIQWLFEPESTFIESVYESYPTVELTNSTAIHIRRGDFKTQKNRFPLITPEYIYKAMEYIPKDSNILIFSDDIQWCKANLNLKNMAFIKYNDPSKAMWCMSLCNHFIISNSTFSWWGSYLSTRQNKIVIHPSTWFGPGFNPTKWNTQDIFCDDWISVPTRYTDGNIIPV